MVQRKRGDVRRLILDNPNSTPKDLLVLCRLRNWKPLPTLNSLSSYRLYIGAPALQRGGFGKDSVNLYHPSAKLMRVFFQNPKATINEARDILKSQLAPGQKIPAKSTAYQIRASMVRAKVLKKGGGVRRMKRRSRPRRG